MGTGLFVYTSDRLEELADALSTVLGRAPLPPLATETVLVPSLGLSRWLRQRLAVRAGIAASLAMPFPGAFLQRLDRSHAAGPDRFDKDVLLFRLWRLLDAPDQPAVLAPATAYCKDDPDQTKRLQLCMRLASCFDDYQLYRPDLLERWSAAAEDAAADDLPHADWQAALWRMLLVDAGCAPTAPPKPRRGRPRKPAPTGPLLFGADQLAAADHDPAPDDPLRLRRLLAALADPGQREKLLPPRLSVFGAGTLPPALLELLGACAAYIEVHLFVPTPTALFTGDVRALDPDSNALFARLGTEAREFKDVLGMLCDRLGPLARLQFDATAHRGSAPPPVSLLERLQQDVAELRVRGSDRGEGNELLQLDPDDNSLRVHSCHSAQRELEVVRDQILAAFAADPALEPHEVLVLVTDIELYAPFAHAVFGPVHEHLPFHVADKNPIADLPLCATLFAVLQLAQDRLEVHDVLHLLEHPAVQRRFRILPSELPAIRGRCERAGIRWGLDGEARHRQFDVPQFEANSWEQGLERLVLGVATGPVDDLVCGALPAADATSSYDDLLVRFLQFVRTLFDQLQKLQQPRSAAQWADRLDAVLTELFDPDEPEDEQAINRLRLTLTMLRATTAAAQFPLPLHRAAVRNWLEQSLQQQPNPRGFLAGAVTIAALQPMRAVPVRHLFVCGLDDASFPRRDRPVAFDLIASERRPGDRSARLDDRQMFLDVLLAARERLHLTYIGRSQKDDSECAPSIVISELLDWLDRSCGQHGQAAPRELVLVQHPLQPWSERYRDGHDARLFTFTTADLSPHPALAAEPAWCTTELPPPPELLAEPIALDRLLEFWGHPSRFFLRQVARLRLPRDEDAEPTTEPFAIGALDRWKLQSESVERDLRAAPPPHDALALMRGTGQLPVGGVGKAAFHEVDDEVAAFLATIHEHGKTGERPLDVEVAGARVCGTIGGVGTNAILWARIANVKPKDRLRAFVLHAFAAAARHTDAAADWPSHTVVLGKHERLRYQPLSAEEARHFTQLLLAGYRAGLRAPLPLFEYSSFALGKALCDRKPLESGLRAAAAAWAVQSADSWPRGDSEDRDIALCWRGRDPLATPDFHGWAERLWCEILGRTEQA